MKNIKISAIILSALLILSGCSSANLDKGFVTETTNGWNSSVYDAEAPKDDFISEDVFDSSAPSESAPSESIAIENRKLIRTFNLDVETLDFDSFVSSLKNEVNSVGGYLESSSVSGNSYNYSSNRNANFVCRIPSDKLDSFVGTVDGLGNVTYSYEDTTDVTLNYVDTEARIKSLQTEYDQLLELLSTAENVDTIILLQQRLTEVRYQLETYQSQLRTYDNLVDYSTVNLSVCEVKRVTSTEQKTVWERISSDFSDNIYSIYVGAEDFLVWFVANIPYFILWAIIIAAAAAVINLCLRKNVKWQEYRAAKKARKAYKKAQKLSEKNNENNKEN